MNEKTTTKKASKQILNGYTPCFFTMRQEGQSFDVFFTMRQEGQSFDKALF